MGWAHSVASSSWVGGSFSLPRVNCRSTLIVLNAVCFGPPATRKCRTLRPFLGWTGLAVALASSAVNFDQLLHSPYGATGSFFSFAGTSKINWNPVSWSPGRCGVAGVPRTRKLNGSMTSSLFRGERAPELTLQEPAALRTELVPGT